MKKKRLENGLAEQRGMLPEQRSFLVEVLNWFYFKPRALRRPWMHEEVLTWELLRALALLPQSMFLKPLLHDLSDKSPEAQEAIAPLLAAPLVTLFGYPSLGETGTRQNSKSDIGFGLVAGSTIWVEAKTGRFTDADLQRQVERQQRALKTLFPSSPVAVVTLLPVGRQLSGIVNLSWRDVRERLEAGVEALAEELPSDDLRAGYDVIAKQLIDRINSHTPSIAKSNGESTQT